MVDEITATRGEHTTVPACCNLLQLNPSLSLPLATVRLQEADLDRPLILTAEALTDNLMRMTALLDREGLPELAEAFRLGGWGGLPELAEAFRWGGEARLRRRISISPTGKKGIQAAVRQ